MLSLQVASNLLRGNICTRCVLVRVLQETYVKWMGKKKEFGIFS